MDPELDPCVSNPDAYQVLFENDRVRVLRYHDHPRHRTTVHAHPDSVMVTLSSFRRRLGVGDREVDVELTAGEARWLDAQQHYGENIGDTDSQAIFVELKDIGPTTTTGIGESRLGPQPRE
jgi:beta-alanine degradation protein BauB